MQNTEAGRLNLPLSSTNSDTDELVHTITKEDILLGGAAFVLRNFLTPDECNDLIAQAERAGLKDSGYSHRIRKTDRASFGSSNLVARWMFDRAKTFLEPSIDLSSSRYPEGIPSSIAPYCWRPIGLNPTLRICRYTPKGFFLPHHDGGHYETNRRQSLRTFMLYLNDDFDGGETRFFNETQRHYVKPDIDNLVFALRPRAGDALIFNSAITHDGAKVVSRRKYILRTEVMYHAPEAEKEGGQIRDDHDVNEEFSWP